MAQSDFFARPTALPEGFVYERDFLSEQDETSLLETIRLLPFQEAQYREWQAKRRIVSYGGRYDFTHQTLKEAPAIAEFLHPLRDRIARWTGISAADLHHAMIAEYRPNTRLGWHRDVPNFEEIIGVSLLGAARMRLRPYPPKKGDRAVHALELKPRPVYRMRGPARWEWQHAISPTKELRYSVTFRTLRSQ
jgi:alkylated DNA repair dioxygenase AlkB